MARKTFIAYKYSEATELRDTIVEVLGEDARFYKGETAESPDISGTAVENIKRHLSGMIFGTSVMIVVISPNLKQSKWVDWEISYSLRLGSRDGTTSRANGMIGVVQAVKGGYDWLFQRGQALDGCEVYGIDLKLLYPIIAENLNNKVDGPSMCETCESFNMLEDSYIGLVREADFLADPHRYIEHAYAKSQRISEFRIRKRR